MNMWIIGKMKVVALLVLTVLVLVACGNTDDNKPKQNSIDPNSQNNEGSKQKTTLKIYVPSNVEEFPSGTDLNTNEIVSYIEEQTGFDVEWEMQPKESVDQKINIMMASGETPDLIITGNKDIYANLAQQGLLAPLEEALQQYGSKIMETVPEETWQAVTLDDHIYAIAVPQNQAATRGMIVRKDILDELNITMPTTIEEWTEALRTIKLKKPELIPYIGGAADGNGNAFGFIENFAGAFGLSANYVVDNDQVVHTKTQPYAKQFLSFMRELYAEGLLDQEYPVNKNPNVQEKMVSGKGVMTTIGWADMKGIVEAFQEKNPNAKLEIVDPPIGENGQFGYQKNPPVRVYMLVPKASSKTAEAVEFINRYMAEDVLNVVSYGWEGKHYQLENDLVVATEEAESIRYRIYYQLWDTVDNFLNRVELKGFGPYYFPIIEHSTVSDITDYAPPLPEVVDEAQALTDLTNEYYVKIISGALPLEAFDEYVSKWHSLGGEASLKAINEWYQTVK